MLNNNQKSPEVLATWNYQPDLWRDFLKYESRIYKGSVRAAKHLFFGMLILTLVVVFLGSLIPILVTKNWNLEMLAPAFGFGIVGWIFIVIFGICWLYRRNRWNRINQRTGEVIITLNGVRTNEVSFDWDYQPFGLRFDKVERKTVSIGGGKTFEILEFYTLNYTKIDTGSPIQENFESRVPIPSGKEAEAEKVINRLHTRLLLANDEWIKENSALGHEFSNGVCQKCGNTVAKSAAFSLHKCPNKK